MWLLAGGHFLIFCLTYIHLLQISNYPFSLFDWLWACCFLWVGMCVVKIEHGKQEQELSGLQIGGLVIIPWGGPLTTILFSPTVHLNQVFRIHTELEHLSLVPQCSEQLGTDMRVELGVGTRSLVWPTELWAYSRNAGEFVKYLWK